MSERSLWRPYQSMKYKRFPVYFYLNFFQVRNQTQKQFTQGKLFNIELSVFFDCLDCWMRISVLVEEGEKTTGLSCAVVLMYVETEDSTDKFD